MSSKGRVCRSKVQHVPLKGLACRAKTLSVEQKFIFCNPSLTLADFCMSWIISVRCKKQFTQSIDFHITLYLSLVLSFRLFILCTMANTTSDMMVNNMHTAIQTSIARRPSSPFPAETTPTNCVTMERTHNTPKLVRAPTWPLSIHMLIQPRMTRKMLGM